MYNMFNLPKIDDNVIECSQIDNIDRDNCITIAEERAAIERAGISYQSQLEGMKNAVNEDAEFRRSELEILDIMDQERKAKVEYEKLNKQLEELKKERKEIYEKIQTDLIESKVKDKYTKRSKRELNAINTMQENKVPNN